MTITLGIRATPTDVTYAIYDTIEGQFTANKTVKLPLALSTPDRLKYLRYHVIDIIRENQVEKAGIRTSEPVASPNVERIQIEAVMQEAFASSSLETYFTGPIATIMSKLKLPSDAFKPMIDGENRMNIRGWEKLKAGDREACLTALGAKNV